MEVLALLIVGLLGLLLGGGVSFYFKHLRDTAKKKTAQQEVDRILNRARSEAQKIEKDARNRGKDFETRARKNAEMEIQKQKSQLKSKEGQLERRLQEMEEQHRHRLDENEKQIRILKEKETRLDQNERRLRELHQRSEQVQEELQAKLHNVSQMSLEEARRELFQSLEEEVKRQSAKKLHELEKQLEQDVDRQGKRILATAVSRFASEYTSERTVSVFPLANDEMKGKIIGREGRNIRTLESLCGVDLFVDTPEAVVISSFDSIRRELARRTLEKLMEDGRVHPARIEEVVEKQKAELNKSLKEEGERACIELGIASVHNEILKSLGSLKYRHSNTQNLLNHSMEVAYLSGLMAAELGVSVKTARRAGLLHDIGKAIDHTVDGSHAAVGADFCKKLGESENVCHPIRAHHNEEQPTTVLALIVQAANLLSNSRPGARRPGMDNFIQRLQDLESIGNSFEGVLRTFAIQAGKEVRVIVEASRVTDDQTLMLSRDIVRKIEREIPQIGQLKVSVVRETRSVEIAR